MITKQDFIKKVEGKRIKEQDAYISAMRFINGLIKKPFKNHIKPTNHYTYLTICNINELDRVEASLFSFVKNTTFHPEEYVIVSDGSWTITKGRSFFEQNPLPILLYSWQECADHFNSTCPSLSKWAYKQIWGRKFAAMMFFSSIKPVLFADSDVLWFDTPIDQKDLDATKLKLSVDNSHNYDTICINEFNLSYLYDSDFPINCGVVFLNGGLSLLTDLTMKCISYQATNCGKFSEQTLFAILDMKFNSHWSPKEIVTDIEDIIIDFNMPTIYYPHMKARHYVWRLKWIFWKDFMRILLNETF